MAQSLDGADGLPMGRPESPLHLPEDEAAPDDAGEAGAGRKRKGKSTRWNIPSSALSMLEQMFQKDKFPSVETRKKIATDLKVTPRQVQVWFQNKRQRSTKPPGRPSDTRSILNTSVSYAERAILSLASVSPATPPSPLALHAAHCLALRRALCAPPPPSAPRSPRSVPRTAQRPHLPCMLLQLHPRAHIPPFALDRRTSRPR